MYHKIPISKLSHHQILKLLRGHRVRVKHGQGHTLHVSEEQHKKIMTAHRKGKAHTLQFDPFQIEAHEHLRGRMHTLPYHPKHPHDEESMEGGSTYAHRVARRTRNTFKPLKDLAHYAIPATLGAIGRTAGTFYGGPIGGIAGSTLGAYAGNEFDKHFGIGEGIKRRGRPKKHHTVHGHGEGEGIKRRRGRPKKHHGHGEALVPAGYGEGEGFGEGDGFIHKHHVKHAKHILGLGRARARGRRGHGMGEGEGEGMKRKARRGRAVY
jgi:hypothetical protein